MIILSIQNAVRMCAGNAILILQQVISRLVTLLLLRFASIRASNFLVMALCFQLINLSLKGCLTLHPAKRTLLGSDPAIILSAAFKQKFSVQLS
jgi:hypothetical protein